MHRRRARGNCPVAKLWPNLHFAQGSLLLLSLLSPDRFADRLKPQLVRQMGQHCENPNPIGSSCRYCSGGRRSPLSHDFELDDVRCHGRWLDLSRLHRRVERTRFVARRFARRFLRVSRLLSPRWDGGRRRQVDGWLRSDSRRGNGICASRHFCRRRRWHSCSCRHRFSLAPSNDST